MDLAYRRQFYEELNRAVSEGYDTPLARSTAARRFKAALDRVGILWFEDMAWYFNGRCYVRLFLKELRGAISACFDNAGVYATVKQINDLVNLCKYRLEGRERSEQDYSRIALKNGILDLDSPHLVLRPHNKEYFITRYFDFDYDANAPCPLWHRFLDEVLPAKALQDVLQEFLGAMFIDRSVNKIEVMLWLYGDGANGKSVVFNTILGILGKENVTARDMRDFLHHSRGSFALSDIEGKLLNYCSDIQGEFTFTDTAKKIISGEPIHAERKYENARMMTRIPLMMANTNTLPKLGDKTNAWARRVKIIPFDITIPEEKQDKELANKLLAEKSGIFSWMLEGRKRLLRQGCKFSEAPQCEQLMYKYRSTGYDVLDFMQAENLSSIKYHVGDGGKEILTKDLYRIFLSWLEVEKAPSFARLSLAQFRTRLRRFGFLPFHSRGGSTIRAYSIDGYKKKERKAIEEEPALQVPTAPAEEEEEPRNRRGDVLEKMRHELEDRL